MYEDLDTWRVDTQKCSVRDTSVFKARGVPLYRNLYAERLLPGADPQSDIYYS